jgi:quinol monooxygenase YgiN
MTRRVSSRFSPVPLPSTSTERSFGWMAAVTPDRLTADGIRFGQHHMEIRRRDFLAAGAITTAPRAAFLSAFAQPRGDMYGLIGKITAAADKRDELIGVLLAGVANMPGCLSYIVAKDANDVNAIWITEVWDSKASHEASLSLPSVKEAIANGRPLIAGFSDRSVTTPVGGLVSRRRRAVEADVQGG